MWSIRVRGKNQTMRRKTLRYELDLANPPPLTARQLAQVAALRARPDSEIDTSDIPPLTKEFWKSAVRNPFYKPTSRGDVEGCHQGSGTQG